MFYFKKCILVLINHIDNIYSHTLIHFYYIAIIEYLDLNLNLNPNLNPDLNWLLHHDD